MTKYIFLAVALLLPSCASTSMQDPGDPGTEQVERASKRVVSFERHMDR